MPSSDSPEKPNRPRFNVDSLWCIYIVSVVAAWTAELITYPLDLVKTRLQVQGEKAVTPSHVQQRRMIKTLVGIVGEEGVFKLWQGMSAIYLRHLIYSGSRVVIYREFTSWLVREDQFAINLWQSAFCGLAAGPFAQFISSPADLVKIQLQMEGRRRLLGLPPRVHGKYDAFKKAWNVGGILGLWRGWVPNVQRAALVNLGDFTIYDIVKRFIKEHTGLPDQLVLHIISSFCAGFAAAGMSTPADVIKTRVMNQPLDEKGRGLLYRSSTDCLKKTVYQEGLGALYKGFIPTWLRLAPWTLTFWISYEQIITFVGRLNF